jgi:hypothetical protein
MPWQAGGGEKKLKSYLKARLLYFPPGGLINLLFIQKEFTRKLLVDQ